MIKFHWRPARVVQWTCLVTIALIISVLLWWLCRKHPEDKSIIYVTYPGYDSPGNDLMQLPLTASQLKLVCSALPECAGFNSDGWLKSKVRIVASSSESKLYVKHFATVSSPEAEESAVDPQAGVFENHLKEYTRMENELKIYMYETQVDASMPFFPGYKYGVERVFFKLLSESVFRTTDPSEATFFFIPTRCSAYRPQLEDLDTGNAMATNITARLLREIVRKYPYWNASLGADHFYICAHDMGTKVATLSDPNLFKNAIALVNTADVAAPMFVPHKDISIPPHPGRGAILWHELGLGGVNIPQKDRTKLLFFAGNVTRGSVRPQLHKYFGNDPDFYIVPGHISDQDYMNALKISQFCLCPRGNEVWSPRIMDALWFGCVPVLVADYYVPPLSSLVDWDELAITVPERKLSQLKDILLRVDWIRMNSLQRNIAKVWKHLTWNDPPRPYDAFHGVLFELWRKRRNFKRVT